MRCLAATFVAMMIWMQPASAADLDVATKTKLQSVMIAFLDDGSDASGAFKIIDRETGDTRSIFPGALHPKIVPFGGDYVLCLEMFDPNGGRHDADFVLRQGPMGWQVVDILFNQRTLLKKALAKVE